MNGPILILKHTGLWKLQKHSIYRYYLILKIRILVLAKTVFLVSLSKLATTQDNNIGIKTHELFIGRYSRVHYRCYLIFKITINTQIIQLYCEIAVLQMIK